MSSGYEFTEQDNRLFRKLSNWVNILTLVLVIGGLWYVYYAINVFAERGFSRSVVNLSLFAVFYLALAYFSRQPLDNLRNIINTKDRDIPELMIAISDLKKLMCVTVLVFGLLILRAPLIRLAIDLGW
jgi:hypothetical protein